MMKNKMITLIKILFIKRGDTVNKTIYMFSNIAMARGAPAASSKGGGYEQRTNR